MQTYIFTTKTKILFFFQKYFTSINILFAEFILVNKNDNKFWNHALFLVSALEMIDGDLKEKSVFLTDRGIQVLYLNDI